MTERRPSASRSALDWAAESGQAALLLEELRRRARRRRRRTAAWTGIAVLVGAVGLALALPREGRRDEAGRPPVVQQPSRQELPDGSLVELREGARLAVDFAGQLRRVALSHGEAHFTVAKDSSRPFVVTAAGMEVRAVGTAFSVQVSPSEVAVLVTEGRVALEHPAATPAPPAPATLLEAGHRAVVAPAENTEHGGVRPQVAVLGPAELAAHLAWRIPRLEFSGTRLGDALQSFSGYSATRVTLADQRLADLRISGIVRADNLAALLQLLERNYAVVVRPGAAGELVLTRK